MILDARTEFADAQAVTGTAGTTINVGSQIDSSVVRDLGNGKTVYLVLNVDTSIITAGSAGTISFQLASDDSASIATNGTQSIHWVSKAFVTDDAALNDLDAGETIACVAIPLDGAVPYERYLGIQANIVTTDTTAGKINAFLTLDPTGWKAYANGI